MRHRKRRPSSDESAGTAPNAKRKFNDDTEKYDSEVKPKRQRLLTTTQTLTLKPHRNHPIPSVTNRFEPISSLSSHRPNDYLSHGRSSILATCNRRWVFSDGDFSTCEGIDVTFSTLFIFVVLNTFIWLLIESIFFTFLNPWFCYKQVSKLEDVLLL